jgi:hypothetical protein
MMIHKQNNLVKVVRRYDTTPTSNIDIVIRFVQNTTRTFVIKTQKHDKWKWVQIGFKQPKGDVTIVLFSIEVIFI